MTKNTERIKIRLAALLVLFCSRSAIAISYDAEADLGLVAENASPVIAAQNTRLLTNALNAQWSGGQFKFVNGKIGPILYPIQVSAKEFFFAGTIATSKRLGGSLLGSGGRSYPITGEHFGAAGSMGGIVTRFTKIDGSDGQPLFRMRGNGFILERIMFQGRPYRGDGTGGGPTGGTRGLVGIEVEGRAIPATGDIVISQCTISDFDCAILAAGGHTDDNGKFVKQEQHADNTQVLSCLIWGCGTVFRSENQQAMNWMFRDIHIAGWARDPMVIFDIVRGGNLTADGIAMDVPKLTLFRVHDYSQNNASLTASRIYRDYFGTENAKDNFITLFEYAGPIYKGNTHHWLKWRVRIDGNIPEQLSKPGYDWARLIVVPKEATDFSLGDIHLDILNLPPMKAWPSVMVK